MTRAALYPLDRFTKGLIEFRDLLGFEIKNVIDFANNVAQEVESTGDIENVLSAVDTLIFNTPSPGSMFFEKWQQMLESANKKGIKLISINELTDEQVVNWLKTNNISVNTFIEETSVKFADYFALLERMMTEEAPVEPNKGSLKKIGVYGTGAGNEQFRLQMSLFRELSKKDKKVTAMMTEPTSFLFNQPDVSLDRFGLIRSAMEFPSYIAAIERKAIEEGADFLIMADQGNAAADGEIVSIICKMVFWIGVKFDEFLLTVGYDDDAAIIDCLDVLRIYGKCKKPLAFLLPDKIEVSSGVYVNKTQEEINARIKALKEKFGIENVWLINDIDGLVSKILN